VLLPLPAEYLAPARSAHFDWRRIVAGYSIKAAPENLECSALFEHLNSQNHCSAVFHLEPRTAARVPLFGLIGNGGFHERCSKIAGKLRGEVAECLVVSNVAADPEKRQLFARVAEHISGLASAVQNELVVPADVVDVVNPKPTSVIHGSGSKEAKAANSSIVPKHATELLRMHPWLVVVVVLAAAGAFVLIRAEKDSSFTALEAKVDPPQAPLEATNQAIADLKQTIIEFRSAEDDKRRLLSQQLDALAARVDNLEKARAEIAEPTTKLEAETVSEATTKPRREMVRRSRHRKATSSRRGSAWGPFGGSPQWRF
jgi:hypothetical protein